MGGWKQPPITIMNDIITDIGFKNDDIIICHAQDVEPVKKEAYAQRTWDTQNGKQGLGVRKASIPEIEIFHAKINGIDLYDKRQRDKWLKSHPQYLCHVDRGLSGKIIIK
jgi:hypothetical protein